MRLRFAISFALCVLGAPGGAAAAEPERYVVVSARAQNVRQELAAVEDLRSVFLGQKLFWSDNARILALIPRISLPSTERFLTEVLNMLPDQYLTYWRRKLFAGKGHPPREVASDEEALQQLREHPNGVSVLTSKPAPATTQGLIVLRVEPGQNRLVEVP